VGPSGDLRRAGKVRRASPDRETGKRSAGDSMGWSRHGWPPHQGGPLFRPPHRGWPINGQTNRGDAMKCWRYLIALCLLCGCAAQKPLVDAGTLSTSIDDAVYVRVTGHAEIELVDSGGKQLRIAEGRVLQNDFPGEIWALPVLPNTQIAIHGRWRGPGICEFEQCGIRTSGSWFLAPLPLAGNPVMPKTISPLEKGLLSQFRNHRTILAHGLSGRLQR
jgi:hypothetical protein